MNETKEEWELKLTEDETIFAVNMGMDEHETAAFFCAMTDIEGWERNEPEKSVILYANYASGMHMPKILLGRKAFPMPDWLSLQGPNDKGWCGIMVVPAGWWKDEIQDWPEFPATPE